METNFNQPGITERVSATLRGGYEAVKLGLSNRAAIGASVLALAGAELAVAAEPVGADINSTPQHELKHSAPLFQPGHYEGTTSETCSADAADLGVCIEGRKIPVSFTATRNKILKFTSAITDTCYDNEANKQPDKVFPQVFTPVSVVGGNQFLAQQDLRGGILSKKLVGHLNKNKAYGQLASTAELNDAGKPDINGDVNCQSDIETWHATRVK